MPCPEGQHFNATLSVCDWPQTAGCVGEKEGAKSSVEKTVETFTTTEPGWSFDVEANFWIFKSKKTTSWPASYKKETIKVSEPCCFFGKGKEDCSDLDPCPEIE
jgi:hypothetical protein